MFFQAEYMPNTLLVGTASTCRQCRLRLPSSETQRTARHHHAWVQRIGVMTSTSTDRHRR